MITWQALIWFALPASLLWSAGAWTGWKEEPRIATGLTWAGILVFAAFIIGLWIGL